MEYFKNLIKGSLYLLKVLNIKVEVHNAFYLNASLEFYEY